MNPHDEFATKADLNTFKEEIIHQFHMVSEGLIDQIKLLAEGHAAIINRFKITDAGLDRIEKANELLAQGHLGIIQGLDGVETRLGGVETRLDRMEKEHDEMKKEDERQHSETRALIKLSFSQLDRRLTDLEEQVKELQEWRKQVENRSRV